MKFAIQLLEREIQSENWNAEHGLIGQLPDCNIKTTLLLRASARVEDYKKALTALRGNGTAGSDMRHSDKALELTIERNSNG